MSKRKFDSDENAEISLANKSSKADDTQKDMGYQVSCPSDTIYSNKNIKLLLRSYFQNENIEDVYILKMTGDHIYFNFVKNLKAILKYETKNKVVSDCKFYIIIEQSVSDLQVSYAVIMKLYSENNKNKIKILTIIHISSEIEGYLFREIKRDDELWKISAEFHSMHDWFIEHRHTAKLYLNNIIEVIKLGIKYESPLYVPYNEIKEVMNTSYAEYEKIHQELLNRLELTNGEEIDKLSPVKKQDEFVAKSKIKKTVSWDPGVENNEGRTRRKKHKFKTIGLTTF